MLKTKKNSMIIIDRAQQAIGRPGTGQRRHEKLTNGFARADRRRIMSQLASKANGSGAQSVIALTGGNESKKHDHSAYTDVEIGDTPLRVQSSK